MASDSSLRFGKFLFLSLCVMTILPSYIHSYPRSESSELVFKKIGETDDYNRFAVEQRAFGHPGCRSGQVDSNYCSRRPSNCAAGNFHINFHAHYQSIPSVVIGLSLLDIDHSVNTRVRIKAKNIDTNGFDISFEPWGGGVAYQMGVYWMACP